MARIKQCAAALSTVVLATFCADTSIAADQTGAFLQLLEDDWEFSLQEDPLWATQTGDHRFNDRLPRETIADQQRRIKSRREFLNRYEAIDRAKISADQQVNYDIYGWQLRDGLAEAEFRMYLIPITNRWGFHISFAELPKRVPLKNVKDYENYIARLRQFNRYTDDHIELLRGGIKEKLTLPAVVLEGFREPIEAHIVEDVTQSKLYAPFEKFPQNISNHDQARLRAAGDVAIRESVVPGYEKFLTFMANEYVPACRNTIGASAMPKGRAFYRHRVRQFTTLDLTPQQVHDTGLSEVKRIAAEMDEVVKESGFKGTRQEFVEFLRTDSQFYAAGKEELLKETALVLKRMDGELPTLFKRLPRTPYGIREVPAYIAPRTTTAYYSTPPGDGTRAGYYYVNTYNLKSRPLYQVTALSLHEAVPGHHLQLALQQELDLPKFRRFSHFTVFIEGWALYAERLGLAVGFYEDPYSNYGRLSYEMWRACRLVVDTGIHYFGWTRQQAIDYMLEHTALTRHNVEAEVDRYIAWPGQALAYKTGELKIRQLRMRAERELGEKFDIREFHDVVLRGGAVPLSVLEANVDAYLEETAAR